MAACYVSRAAAAFERAGDCATPVSSMATSAGARRSSGFAEAESSLRQSLAIGERLGITATLVVRPSTTSAWRSSGSGKVDEARAVESEAVAMLAAQGNRRLEAGARNYLAEVLVLGEGLEAAEQSGASGPSTSASWAHRIRGNALGTYAFVLPAGRTPERCPGAGDRGGEDPRRARDARGGG